MKTKQCRRYVSCESWRLTKKRKARKASLTRTNFQANRIIVLFRTVCLSRRFSRLINDHRIENFIQTNGEWVGEGVNDDGGRGARGESAVLRSESLRGATPSPQHGRRSLTPRASLDAPCVSRVAKGIVGSRESEEKSREYEPVDNCDDLASSFTRTTRTREGGDVGAKKLASSTRRQRASVIQQGMAHLRACCMTCACVYTCVCKGARPCSACV